MNLKPAPFDIMCAASGKVAVVDVPIVPTRLVDQPRRSENPRNAKANDDGDDWVAVMRADVEAAREARRNRWRTVEAASRGETNTETNKTNTGAGS